jgi:virginiamycin B lyase
MRGIGVLAAFAVVAGLSALALAGCNAYNNNNYNCDYYGDCAPIYSGPTLAPTFRPGTVAEYQVPVPAATPFGITEGPDGNMWFTELNVGKVGMVTPSGSFSEVSLPGGASADPEDITSGPNNSVWFVENGDAKIGAINVSTGALTEYNTPTGNSGPLGIAVDPTNSNRLWFGEYANNAIASINASGVITEYPTGIAGATPTDVAVTSDGTVWFLDATNNTVDKMTFPGPTFSECGIPTPDSVPQFMTVGPDGNIWFTESNVDQVAVSITSGGCSIAEIPTPSSAVVQTIPLGITVSPEDDLIWFAEYGAGQVADIKSGDVISEHGLPGNNTTAVEVAPGPDSAGAQPDDLWFTDSIYLSAVGIGTDMVGKVNLADVTASSTRKPLSEMQHRSKAHMRVQVRNFAPIRH